MSRLKIKFQPYVTKEQKIQDEGRLGIHKFAVQPDISGGQFFCMVRNRCQLKEEEALFLFVGTKDEPKLLMNQSQLLSQMYKEWGQDGILHIYYTSENTFG